jgi:hypothetical protein
MPIEVRGLVLALCVLGNWAPARAQQTIDTGSISGQVADAQGAPVPGASVTTRQTETNATRSAVTDRDGRFRFSYLPVGRYELSVSLAGFSDVHRTVMLSAGSAFDLPVRLAIAGLDTSVTVKAEAPLVEAARSQIASTVSRSEIAKVPSNGRSFLDLALLAPDVSPANTASTQAFAETSAVPGGGISVASQRNFSNSFIVDGMSANDDAAGLSGVPYALDAIDEFQIVTSGGQAQLGRALGGYFTVVTRSGTNDLAADAYGYFRDDALNAPNALSGTTLPMDQQQFGGSLGGPIVRDRTFFFTNAERRSLDQTGLVTINPAAAAAINGHLADAAYPGAAVQTGPYRSPLRSTNYLGKVDHAVNPSNRITMRYALYDVHAVNSRGAGGLSAPSASAALDNLDQAAAVSHTAILSARTVMEARAQVTHSNLEAPASDPVGPAVSVAGVASFGTLSVSPTARVNTMVEAEADLSHQAGDHALRGGIDFLYNADRITFPRASRGSYTFASMDAFLAGRYDNAGFTQTFGDSGVAQRNPNLGLYAQDEWKITSDLTLNAGVRYDLQFLDTIRTDADNVSPRVGFAWSPFAGRRTVVRGSVGLYYDRVPLRALANALLSAGNTTDPSALRQVLVTLSPGQSGAPVFPATLDAPVPSVTLPNLTTMDRHMQNAFSRQAGVEVEQQIGARATVSAGYEYVRGGNLIVALNQNVPSCVPAGRNNGCRPDPAFGNVNQYSSRASSSYHALHVSLVQRPARWGQVRVSYTFSRAMSDVGEFFFSSPIDPFDLSKDWGRADDDRRHRFVVNGTLKLPARFELSGTARAYSALPLNVMSGLTTLQGTAGRPIVDGAYIRRNAGTGPDFMSVDLRFGRSFDLGPVDLDALLEGFNVTNRKNAVALNGNFGPGTYPTSPAASFGHITAVSDPRSFQIGVRASFGRSR